MSAVSPEAVRDTALLGWRSWRVLPFYTLEGRRSYRLCACGRYGLPKLWQPRRAIEAVCGDFASQHEAPWPAHECGIHAYRDAKAAEDHLASFINGNGEGTVGWAFGQVALWGRVVECEYGWRAQFAYPYALTVYGDPEVARAIRDLYAVEVEVGGRIETPEEPEEEAPSPLERLEEVDRRLTRVQERLTVLSLPPREQYRESRRAKGVDAREAVEALLAQGTSLGAVRSAEVAAHMKASGEFFKWDTTTEAIAKDLKDEAMAGRLVQLRRKGRYGVSFWTLPGHTLDADFAKDYQPFESSPRPFDARVLEALKQAVAEAGGEVGIKAVLRAMGETSWTKSFEGRTAQALVRLKRRELVTSSGPYGRFAWNVA